MKKFFIAIAAIAMTISMASCSKTCNCVAKYDDNKIEKTITLDEGEKCSDYNTSVAILGHSATFKCTPKLF